MSSLVSFSNRKKLTLASLAVMALLLISGSFTSVTFASSSTSIPSTSTTLPATAPTFVGTAGRFLSGPFLVLSAFGGHGEHDGAPNTPSSSNIPSGDNVPNLKPGAAKVSADPPIVSCAPLGSGCYTISSSSGGANTNLFGLNAVSNFNSFGYNIEPPDQGVCANNRFVMEILNVGELQVYSSSSLKPVSGVIPLDNVMGLAAQPPLGWSSAGDIQCQYDYNNGGHWFITEFVSTTPEAPLVPGGQPGPFQGCFVGVFDTCREGIAVSVTNNPMGAYNTYFLDPNAVNLDPGVGFFLNDFVKTGTTADAFMLFYDEFNLNPATFPACPAFGCAGFNGAQEFAFNKMALELGWPSAFVNVAYENMGTAPNLNPIPASPFQFNQAVSCSMGFFVSGVPCWYQVIPAQTPDPSQYVNSHKGTGFMVAALDFFGLGDNRIAVFEWTGLSNLNRPGVTSGVKFGGQILTTPITYMDEGAPCLASLAPFCGLGAQKTGPIPLGNACVAHGLNGTDVTSCPESGIATNGDGTTQASFANGELWTSVSTQIIQTFGDASEVHIGAAFWGINPRGETFTVLNGGYVSASHEDIEYPTIAATDGGSALMSFTLSGNDYFPSSAYTWLTGGSSTIFITAMGQSPQDGFTEYQSLGTPFFRPRWGDYGGAIFVPSWVGSKSGHVIFASEYIQSPNCENLPAHGLACGGTRTVFANWGSSVNSLAVSSPSRHSRG